MYPYKPHTKKLMQPTNVLSKGIQKLCNKKNTIVTQLEQQNVQQILFQNNVLKFHIMAVGYWDAGIPDTLPIYLWYHNIQQYTNYTKKKIVFKQLQYILPNWTGDQYPSVIYLCVENIFGYNDFMGNGTERLAALQLQSLNPVLDGAQVKTYDLKYATTQGTCWKIPNSGYWENILRFYITTDADPGPITLPLPAPMLINFQIRLQ